MPKLLVSSDDNDLRLDIYLTRALPDVPSRSFIKRLIDASCIQVNGKVVTKPGHKVHKNDALDVTIPDSFYEPENLEAEDIPLNIFYEDDDLLVINKPIGMVVHPAKGNYTGTLANALKYHCDKLSDYNSEFRPGIVHRLDEETSGLLLVAKDNITHTKLAKQFERHTIQKRYVALVEGAVEFDEGMIDAPLARHSKFHEKRDVQFTDAAKDALTYYQVVKRANGATLIILFPQTGRTHQLRVHMAYLGHPILGDSKYGKKNNFPRMALHAQCIGFIHPGTRKYIEFFSKTPKEFLEKMKK